MGAATKTYTAPVQPHSDHHVIDLEVSKSRSEDSYVNESIM